LLLGACAASATDCASALPVTVSRSDNRTQVVFVMTRQLSDFIMARVFSQVLPMYWFYPQEAEDRRDGKSSSESNQPLDIRLRGARIPREILQNGRSPRDWADLFPV
jgi:hypothetical protein